MIGRASRDLLLRRSKDGSWDSSSLSACDMETLNEEGDMFWDKWGLFPESIKYASHYSKNPFCIIIICFFDNARQSKLWLRQR